MAGETTTTITDVLGSNDIEATNFAAGGIITYTDVMICDVVSADSIKLNGLAADPVDAKDGWMWYRSDLGKLRVNIAGVVKTVTFDP